MPDTTQPITDEALRQAVTPHVKEAQGKRKLSCHQAHVLADQLGIPRAQVGAFCEQEGIRIINCQLGCFGDGGKHA